jgi:hypothetical protein
MWTTPLGAGILAAGVLVLAAPSVRAQAPAQAPAPDRIYGQVHTAAGQVYEGFIRWDRNEGSWWDLLDGSRDLDAEVLALARGLDPEARTRERSVEFLGVRITWNEDPEGPSTADAGIRFGHLASLRVTGDDRARLTLRSGQEVDLHGGGTDLGDDVRQIVVEDRAAGPVELRWHDLDRIDFRAAPPGVAPRAVRLYGTVVDRWGSRFRGYVSWDLDEILSSDVLDGREGRRDRQIPFEAIAGIERLGPDRSRVLLVSGEVVELGGSNDVGEGHRGVQISDPGLGQVHVPWREFLSVRFERPPPDAPGRESFDGGARLHGTVDTEDGESWVGWVTWDADEAWSWEMLNGRWRGLVFDIEFGQVASIRKRSHRSAEVTLLDGRTFELEGSNDVSRDNKGIVVEVEGAEPVVIDWSRFRRLTLTRS